MWLSKKREKSPAGRSAQVSRYWRAGVLMDVFVGDVDLSGLLALRTSLAEEGAARGLKIPYVVNGWQRRDLAMAAALTCYKKLARLATCANS
ncbi:hypothetical protein GCM10009837_03960 [Streptomyces durmitorensis]|uniref:Uncharacterized protein n=1 Tax=Streptomyces durmitorensis TaxID=319947 RepID=A0ABY4PLT3_9ACTN|nr:hypothetical protein [Streptomyces durmitorensis]UQT54676.1 hypothetical protein M4V62_05955 [Streptomyces durmitorensis]